MDEPLPDGAQSGLSSYIGSAQQSCTDLDSSKSLQDSGLFFSSHSLENKI